MMEWRERIATKLQSEIETIKLQIKKAYIKANEHFENQDFYHESEAYNEIELLEKTISDKKSYIRNLLQQAFN